MNSGDRKKILSSAVMLVIFAFTLSFALLAASRAWFSANKVVSATGMQVVVQQPDKIVATWQLYDLNTAEGVDNSKTLHFIPAEGETATAMPDYELANATNIYKLLEVTVTPTANTDINEIIFQVTTTTDYFMDRNYLLMKNAETKTVYIGSDGNVYKNQDGVPENVTVTPKTYKNCLSSVVGFMLIEKTGEGTTTITDENGTEKEVAQITFAKPDLYSNDPTDEAARKSFAEFKDGKYSIEPGSVTLHTVSATAETTFYILIYYSEAQLSYVFSENIGNQDLMDESVGGIVNYGGVDFKNDFTFELTVNNG